MRSSSLPVAFLAVQGLAGASPLNEARQYGGGSPCAQVSASAAAAAAATPTVDGKLAYDCLNSVKLHKKEAIDLVDSILPYVEWQSDPTYLKDPPPGYTEPAVDINAEFQAVLSGLKGGSYANEYKFQADLFRRFNLAHDGHFRFFPDLLTRALRFSRNVGLVSVSLTGSDIPAIYVHGEVDSYNAGGKKPSPVTTINGQDAAKFLEDWSQLGALNDPDALYNAVFFAKPYAANTFGWEGYFAGSGRFGYIYPGESTVLGFKNGTKHTYRTTSGVIGNFTGVTDGESFYKKFCTGPIPAAPAAPPAPAATQVPGYPKPVIVSSDHVVSGYYLDGDNSDVAVLAMTSFSPEIPAEFQAVVENFFAEAKSAGKTKLVIDVSANGGGYILQGYDTFRQLFPQIEQDGFTRFRHTKALRLMAEQISSLIPANYNPDTAPEDIINFYESVPNYRYDLNLQNKHFKSVADKFGPVEYNHDLFTNIIRWDLNDPLTTSNATWGMGMDITGYRSRRNFTQPFKASDIILLYDGYCASTCTLFSEFMRLQGGVKSISIGGRPSKAPMQTLGGTKGSNNYGYSYINYLAQLTLSTGTQKQQQSKEWQPLRDLTELPIDRSSDTSLNVRDNILRPNLKDGVPAQFIYEAANCRLFYEPKMISDISVTWNAAADAAWGSKKCVQGGLGGGYGSGRTKPAAADAKPEAFSRILQSTKQFGALQKDAWWKERHGEKIPL